MSLLRVDEEVEETTRGYVIFDHSVIGYNRISPGLTLIHLPRPSFSNFYMYNVVDDLE
jgi:hypothetical protein